MQNINAAKLNIKIKPQNKFKLKKITPGKLGVYTVLTLWSITTFAPLLWVLNNSFKSSGDILSNSMTLTKKIDFTNFKTIMSYADIGRAFINSFIISGSVVILVLIIGGFAAFAISRFNLKYGKWIKMFLFVSMLVPQYSILVPNLLLLSKLHLGSFHVSNSYLSIIIPQVASSLSLVILIISGYMASLPTELEEAAIMDGCSIPKIFFKITMPLSLPIFSTAGILTFLFSYNDLLLSLVYISDRTKQPICVILSLVSSVFGTNYGALMAAIMVTILPVLAIYTVSQEYVIKGLTSGAVKG
jgi:raffinose/stachyose/melibiose transport system permease protein